MVRIKPKHRSSVAPFEPLDCQINEKKQNGNHVSVT